VQSQNVLATVTTLRTISKIFQMDRMHPRQKSDWLRYKDFSPCCAKTSHQRPRSPAERPMTTAEAATTRVADVADIEKNKATWGTGDECDTLACMRHQWILAVALLACGSDDGGTPGAPAGAGGSAGAELARAVSRGQEAARPGVGAPPEGRASSGAELARAPRSASQAPPRLAWGRGPVRGPRRATRPGRATGPATAEGRRELVARRDRAVAPLLPRRRLAPRVSVARRRTAVGA
jgi:hypothetical protein